MKLNRSLLLFVSLLPIGACTSTTESQPTVAASDAAPRDWIAERWPTIARVEESIAAADLDGARRLLVEWAKPSVVAVCADLDDESRVAIAQRIDRLAEALSLLGVQLEARELLHEVLERVLTADHPDLLAVKQNLAVSRMAQGDLAGAQSLFEHVLAARERSLPADHPKLLDAKQNLAAVHYASGDLEDALALFEHVYAARERLLPADHPELLRAAQNLAATRAQLGDIEGAHELFEQVHAGRERLLPADHPDLLAAKLNLAAMRNALGDLTGALELQEYVHAAWSRLLPPDHPRLLAAKSGLASTRRELGDLAGALELQEYVHAAWARLLPADHPDLLLAKQNLAATRAELGDLAGALEVEEYVHAARERLLPPDHPDLLLAKQNLAATRGELGDLAGALELQEYVHAAQERLLPPDHPDLLSAKQNLAGTRAALGDLAGALELFEYVHAARERLLPPDHPDLLGAKLNLAMTRSELGDLAGALELEEYVHTAWARLLPPDHPALLIAKQNLAGTRAELGDLAGALELFEYVHAARERLLPPDHPGLLTTKQNLAVNRKELGDLAGAVELEEYVLAARERLLPRDHPDLLAAKANLATTRHKLGDLADALVLFQDVHTAWERLLPPDHPDLLGAKQNLALARKESGDLAGALELQEYVLAAQERLLPPDHPDLLGAKENLAAMRHRLGDLAGARELTEYVHAARVRLLPPDHPDLLGAKQSLSGTRSELGDLEGALELDEYVHAARERLLPRDHPDLLGAKENLAMTREDLGDLAGALELEEYVHAARVRLLPPDHPDLLRVKQNLAVTRGLLGDLAGALELEEYVDAARERLFPPDHPDVLSAQVNLATTRHELGDLVGLRAASASLLEAQVLVADGLGVQSPRLARSVAVREFKRLARVLGWSQVIEAGGEDSLDFELFAALESLRQASSASADVARAAERHPELEALVIDLVRVRRNLADLSQAGPAGEGAVDAWRTTLLQLTELRDRLQRGVRGALAEHGIAIEMPSVAGVAHRLAPEAALVSYFRYLREFEADPVTGETPPSIDSLLALVVTPDADVVRIELGAAEVVEREAERWRAALGAALEARAPGIGIGERDDDEAADAGAALRAFVLDPIFAAVPDATELRCVLDDVLFLLPLDALPLDGGVVGDRYTLRVGSTVRQVFEQFEPDAGAPSLLVLGGVDYSGTGVEAEAAYLATARPPVDRAGSGVLGATFGALPGATLESESVAECFDTSFARDATVICGADATKAALIELVVNARYLHVATHGWFAPESAAVSMLDAVGESASDALRLSVDRAQDTVVGFLPETLCGLALAGANHGPEGILTAEELATLDLTNCELAVLSACETNVGIRRAGQGIQSLQTALHAAGARTAITSLWKVDDAATRRLFEVFYTKLWSEKLGPADALWQAKMALRNEGHPTRDWAGWVLTGDPD